MAMRRRGVSPLHDSVTAGIPMYIRMLLTGETPVLRAMPHSAQESEGMRIASLSGWRHRALGLRKTEGLEKN